MSNPVEPPHGAQNVPPADGGQAFPPPNAGAPGFPPPNAGAPGFPPPGAPGAAGFPPPPGAPAGFPAPAPAKKSGGKKALSIVGAIVAALVIFGLKFGLASALSSDPTKDAKVNDCISVSEDLSDKAKETEAEIVDCGKSDAKFVVVGRVDGTDDVNSTACDQYFKETDKDPAVLTSSGDDKYLLCVKAAK
ncbi:LppU/SCO3897 family protein [Actinoplanes teichomyceticus]|uniref:Uncharacterized protein n=1 Tax=Actinoplanes teichomyceticus TaxID=1867 RepID=A0A561VQ52_ACTTI|nr:hypothetical protein [Actinoplanes teichomyceticus]TWG13751.1 hypothetical protein FHX34_10439 [Actinoplanes teichomyceticus]GIF12424.1 hypothetical protein Ate01nite_24560 [Actinoplanes teichomyceticus]